MTMYVTSTMPNFLDTLRVYDLELSDRPMADCPDGFRLPGMIDLHIHGAYGFDFTHGGPDRIEATLDKLIECGLTGIVPTLITCPEGARIQALADLKTVALRRRKPPRILGIYLEGPFLSPHRCGSHPPALLMKPDLEALKRWQNAAGGLIKLITIAPELDGAIEFMSAARRMGVIPAIGHTDADHETTCRACPEGIGHVTHLYNAMRPFSHREPSVLSALFQQPRVTVEIIGDGIHVAPEIVAMTYRIFGARRISLISDGICPLGMPNGTYEAYGQKLIVEDGRCALESGKLFGGGLPLIEALRVLSRRAGLSLRDLALSVGFSPAAALGIELPAGDVILDRELRWLATHFDGKWYCAQHLQEAQVS